MRIYLTGNVLKRARLRPAGPAFSPKGSRPTMTPAFGAGGPWPRRMPLTPVTVARVVPALQFTLRELLGRCCWLLGAPLAPTIIGMIAHVLPLSRGHGPPGGPLIPAQHPTRRATGQDRAGPALLSLAWATDGVCGVRGPVRTWATDSSSSWAPCFLPTGFVAAFFALARSGSPRVWQGSAGLPVRFPFPAGPATFPGPITTAAATGRPARLTDLAGRREIAAEPVIPALKFAICRGSAFRAFCNHNGSHEKREDA